MGAALDDFDRTVFYFINYTVFSVYATAPVARQISGERLWFTYASVAVTLDIFDKFNDLFSRFATLSCRTMKSSQALLVQVIIEFLYVARRATGFFHFLDGFA